MRRHKLFSIEDDMQIADLICRVASEVGYETHTTTNFREIAQYYELFNPDVIILDIMMPDMDGFEILQTLHQKQSDAQIIILSGQGEFSAMAARMAIGLNLTVAGQLTKPFRIHTLRHLLEQVRHHLLLTPWRTPAHGLHG